MRECLQFLGRSGEKNEVNVILNTEVVAKGAMGGAAAPALCARACEHAS